MKLLNFCKIVLIFIFGCLFFNNVQSMDFIRFHAKEHAERLIKHYGAKRAYEQLMTEKYQTGFTVSVLLSTSIGLGYGAKKLYSSYKEKLKKGEQISKKEKAGYIAGIVALGLLTVGTATISFIGMVAAITSSAGQQIAWEAWQKSNK